MKILSILAVAALAAGCALLAPDIESRTMPGRNPTHYDFHAPLPHIRECIRGVFGGDKEMALELSQSQVVLDSKGRPVGISPVYHQDGVSLPVGGKYHLSLTTIPGGTRVEIYAMETVVLFEDGARRIPVAPTTVEEYSILLRIGDCVGEKGMPLLLLPNTLSQ